MMVTHRLRSRVDYLSRVERLLEALCERLTYSAQPLTALWRSLSEDTVLSAYPLVKDTANSICKGNDFYTSFERAIQAAERTGHLAPAEAALLADLGGSLGHSGLAEQAQLIHLCIERLGYERQTAQTMARERGRVYPTLGFAGGLCLALLLM